MDLDRLTAMLERLQQLNERNEIEHHGSAIEFDTDRYVSVERHALELERIFRHGQQLVALTADLPESGSYLPTAIGDVPVLLVRREDGTVGAFVNACRHRGSAVCEEPGTGRRLSCPYHGWTYDLDGRLVAVPDRTAFTGCIEDEGLRSLPVDERYGLIVCDPDPAGSADVDDYLGPMAPEIAHLGFETLTPITSYEAEVAMNWKLASDAAMESYHVPYLHKTTVGPMARVGYTYDRFGRHHRMGILGKGDEIVPTDERDALGLLGRMTLVHHFYPTSMMPVGAGVVAHQRCEPGRTPDTCRLRLWTYSWSDMTDEEDRKRRHYVSDLLWKVVNDEDNRVCTTAQRAFSSGALERVVFGAGEAGLTGMHQNWDAAISI
jgi:phenylpropionate dioxygenase-like ring-hydroxylating dioxygenase large terminal subunit